MAHLDQIMTLQFFARNFFKTQSAETFIYSVLANNVLKQTNLDQIIAPQKAKLGPDLHNIYTYAVKSGSGPILGVLKQTKNCIATLTKLRCKKVLQKAWPSTE